MLCVHKSMLTMGVLFCSCHVHPKIFSTSKLFYLVVPVKLVCFVELPSRQNQRTKKEEKFILDKKKTIHVVSFHLQ